MYFRNAPPELDPIYQEILKRMTPQKKKNLGIKRETAERILKEIVQRAEATNTSPEP